MINEINKRTQNINQGRKVQKNQKKLLNLRIMQNTIVNLLRASKRNDFNIITADLSSDLNRLMPVVPRIQHFQAYILKKSKKKAPPLLPKIQKHI